LLLPETIHHTSLYLPTCTLVFSLGLHGQNTSPKVIHQRPTKYSNMPTITLPQGRYRGGTASGTHVNYYHGIPYCQPFERFQSPKPITGKATSNASSDEVIDATQFGPICPQNSSKLEPYIYGPWPTPPNGGEADESRSGVLSVYQPESAVADGDEKSLLPVIVCVHHLPHIFMLSS